jgi:hypothetical protein
VGTELEFDEGEACVDTGNFTTDTSFFDWGIVFEITDSR